MTHAVRRDKSPEELRLIAEGECDEKVKQRLLAIAFVLEGESRREAAARVGMSRPVLAEWVVRYNSGSVTALRDKPKPSRPRGDLLVEVFPDMAPWFAEENDVSFDSLPRKSNIARLWKCRRCAQAGKTTIYLRKVSDQVKTWESGGGCGGCKPAAISEAHLARAVARSSSLDVTHPELIIEYHSDNRLAIHQLTAGSKQNVKWLCPKCTHVWNATPYTRTNLGCGCRKCSTTFSRIEARFHAEVAARFADAASQFTDEGRLPEIDIFIPSLNLGIEVDGFRHKHRYEQDRRKNTVLAEAGIDLIRVRQDVLEPIEPCFTIDFGLDELVIFSKFQEWVFANVTKLRDFAGDWLSKGAFRAEDHYERLCASASYPPEGGSVSDHYPWVYDVWNPENRLGPDAFHVKSHRVVKWICAANPDHLYEASIADRMRSGRMGCPFCRGPRLTYERSLAAKKPSVAAQWDETKNVKPASDVAASSDGTAWFLCKEGHSYEARIASTKEEADNCTVCRAEKRKSKSLASQFPILLCDWERGKNEAIGLDPEITSAVSQSEAHWKCYKCDHEWQAEVQSRTRAKTRCPNLSCRHSHWTDKPARAGPNTPNRSKRQ
ncbi:zinc-ribbon domain-containing protein (plasmid) [Rhizobium sp. WSM4643]|uniref:zinc-ribbon domain-containing protein n=1 Tax=Rhizobium sp. WSM4643 TaxID=3138253 RepID=UPI0021A7FA2C|nr:zinc-ribbon domain-containing protein [Rhizobium leguminosarum]UWM78896.1 zinc-ribbon domain-containing protein [Rhizobium leguminosarum bv. viciae]